MIVEIGLIILAFCAGYFTAKRRFYKSKRLRTLAEINSLIKSWTERGNAWNDAYKKNILRDDCRNKAQMYYDKIENIQEELAEAKAVKALEDEVLKEISNYDKR